MRCENRRRFHGSPNLCAPSNIPSFLLAAPWASTDAEKEKAASCEAHATVKVFAFSVNRAAVRLQPQYGPSQGADGAVSLLMLPTITGWIEQ